MAMSKYERKKLLRMQAKGQQKEKHASVQRTDRTKTYVFFGIIALAVFGIAFFIYSRSTTTWPGADDDPVMGDANASLTVIEFGDYKCPYTRQFNQGILDQLIDEYGDRVKFVYRDMPTGLHGDSVTPAVAAGCAAKQGKFKEYHDALFREPEATAARLKAIATSLGLDREAFDRCFDDKARKTEVMDDYRDGRAAQVSQTPTIFIGDNIRLDGLYTKTAYEDAINFALKN
ncbi:MAG: thioredoxin domain-containing protein [DPANN group archaeon]|nr:thioredoxin domain-containing protein [DPANN group archaeon]